MPPDAWIVTPWLARRTPGSDLLGRLIVRETCRSVAEDELGNSEAMQ